MSAAEELPGAEEVYGTAIAPATVTRSVFRNHWRPSIARTVPSVGKLRDHVGAMGGENLQPVFAVDGFYDVEPGASEGHAQHVPHRARVIDREDSTRHEAAP